jgi:hypothetical protein
MRIGKQHYRELVTKGLVDTAPRGRAKYGNAETLRTIDGAAVRFASRAEARRWDELLVLWQAGSISRPLRQTRWPLARDGQRLAVYVADFYYLDLTASPAREVVEDVKGCRTAVYRLKARLFLACYGFAITEIGGRA